jgi:hypothetical protein
MKGRKSSGCDWIQALASSCSVISRHPVQAVQANQPGRAYLEVGDDGHADGVVVERLQQDAVGAAVHGAYRGGQRLQQLEGLVGEVLVDVLDEADAIEQVVHRLQAHRLVLELVGVAGAQQGLEVGEGDCPPSAVAIAAAGAEIGVFGGQRRRLGPVDGVGRRVLGGYVAAVLALADQRALLSSVLVMMLDRSGINHGREDSL